MHNDGIRRQTNNNKSKSKTKRVQYITVVQQYVVDRQWTDIAIRDETMGAFVQHQIPLCVRANIIDGLIGLTAAAAAAAAVSILSLSLC